MRTQKAWGWNDVLHSTPVTKICRLYILPGGFCSWHHHAAKDNTFIVEHGTLTVEERGGDEPDRYTLGHRAHFTVRPGVVHRFINYSTAPVQVLEVESLVGIDDADIYRLDEGGLLNGKAR